MRGFRGLSSWSLAGAASLALTAPVCEASVAAAPVTEPAASCKPEAGLKFLCGIRSPEDLAMIPGTRWLVSGSLATDGTGGLYAVDNDRPALRRLYPAQEAVARPDLKTYPDCATPPDAAHFTALGLSIRPRAGGGATLYTVGGGARSGIEIFELDMVNGAPRATWVGCVKAPEGATLNGVAGMFAGEILTTAIFEAPFTFDDARAGKVTGSVYARTPGKPFEKVPGTAQPGNNGIEVSRDHHWMFVAVTGARQVLRYDRTDGGKPPVAVPLPFGPDNLRWGPNGKLLVAGNERAPGCVAGATCPSVPTVLALDPISLETSVVAALPTTTQWFGMSGALIVGDTLWLGSYRGDRIAYRPLP